MFRFIQLATVPIELQKDYMKSGQSLFSLVLAPAQIRAARGFAASTLAGISRSLAKRLAWENSRHFAAPPRWFPREIQDFGCASDWMKQI